MEVTGTVTSVRRTHTSYGSSYVRVTIAQPGTPTTRRTDMTAPRPFALDEDTLASDDLEAFRSNPVETSTDAADIIDQAIYTEDLISSLDGWQISVDLLSPPDGYPDSYRILVQPPGASFMLASQAPDTIAWQSYPSVADVLRDAIETANKLATAWVTLREG